MYTAIFVLGSICIALVATFAIWMAFWLIPNAKLGFRSDFDGVRRMIEQLLKRGYDGGFIVITHKENRKWLQLRKYIRAKGQYGIELGFPNADWSGNYFNILEAFCQKQSIGFNVVHETSGDPMDFLYIDFKKDVDKAHTVIGQIFREVLGVNDPDVFYTKIGNATIHNELIDEPGKR